MRRSFATPQEGRKSLLGFGSANANSRRKKVPEQKKLNFSLLGKSKLHTPKVGGR